LILEEKNAQKVVVAMSGGIDSAVAAALLKRVGSLSKKVCPGGNFEVIGVFMRLWGQIGSSKTEERARKVAKILKIPFYVFNFEKEFKKRVVDYFLKEYKQGRTPNPCVICNKEIKFGFLMNKALKLGADYLATGHYVHLCWQTRKLKSRIQKLLRARDKNKDQSYFLWMLNQDQLKKILFPIGNYTRAQVEKLAKKFKLNFLLKVPKSTEICFIPKTINDFLRKYLQPRPGAIATLDGRKVGKHQGLCFYTIGQRKGIGLPGGPYYVLEKNLNENILVVTKNEKDLYKKELLAKNVNWISGREPKLPLEIKAKIRYHQQPASAIITKILDFYLLKFFRPQRAITPGQSVVFYKGEEVIGGGIIELPEKT